jgi:hypothetical protein
VTNLTGEQKITLAVRGVVPQRRQAMVTKKPRTRGRGSQWSEERAAQNTKE